MKKFLSCVVIVISLCSCGKYKELDKAEKFSILYRAQILREKSAREEINKIFQDIEKYIAKNNKDAIKEMEEYENIMSYLERAGNKYIRSLPGNGWLISNDAKYPPLKEINGNKDEPMSAHFRLYSDGNEIYDYLTNKLFTGTAVFRYGNGEIDEVVQVENGKIIRTIQKNKFTKNNILTEEIFYDENKNIQGLKKYTQEGGLKEELYILDRYSNGKVKKDYIIFNKNNTGEIREYNINGKIIKKTEKPMN